MCRTGAKSPAPAAAARPESRHRRPLLLLTHDAFVSKDLPDKDDARKSCALAATPSPWTRGLGGPPLLPTLLTVTLYVALLFLLEHLTRLLIAHHAGVAPVLASARNQAILARHIAVDFVALCACVAVAVANRHECRDLIRHGLSRGRSDGMKEEDFEDRLFRYRPGAQRLITLFFVYQVKNMHDTLYWGDGIAFVLHHIFAGVTAWGGMFPGCCHFYALFYFGFSEISTAILCLLANFDPDFGVAGLEEAFPTTKIVLGALFTASFVVCRLIMWPFVTYHFTRDSLRAIRSDAPRAEGRRGYLRLIVGCCAGLTAIQFVFVAMIVQHGKAEYRKFMHPEL